MRIVFAAVLIVGLGLAGTAVYLIRDYIGTMENTQAQAAPAVPMTNVVVVKRDLAYGERVTRDDLTFAELPTGVLPKGVFTTPDEVFPRGMEVERSVLRAMLANEPLLASKVTDPGEAAGVSSRLSDGKRAFAISVDVASGVSGFLRPNDRVDIFWTGNLPGDDRRATKLIDTNVRIVAVDQSADEERTGATVARTVTIEATPRQVASLAQAQSSGRLSLALVGVRDETISASVEIDQRELLGVEEEQRRVEAPAPERCTVRTRRGSDVVEIPIPCTN